MSSHGSNESAKSCYTASIAAKIYWTRMLRRDDPRICEPRSVTSTRRAFLRQKTRRPDATSGKRPAKKWDSLTSRRRADLEDYFNQPEKPRRSLRGGWRRSGDAGEHSPRGMDRAPRTARSSIMCWRAMRCEICILITALRCTCSSYGRALVVRGRVEARGRNPEPVSRATIFGQAAREASRRFRGLFAARSSHDRGRFART